MSPLCASIYGCQNPGTNPIADRFVCDQCWAKSRMRGAEHRLELQIGEAIQGHRVLDASLKNLRYRFGEEVALATFRRISTSTLRAGGHRPDQS